jgi:hypothetical protein
MKGAEKGEEGRKAGHSQKLAIIISTGGALVMLSATEERTVLAIEGRNEMLMPSQSMPKYQLSKQKLCGNFNPFLKPLEKHLITLLPQLSLINHPTRVHEH